MGKHGCYKCGMYDGTTETSIVRLVCVARRVDHTNPLFKQLGILKCVDLVKFEASIIMFRAYYNELPDSLQKMFNLYVQIYATRQKYLPVFIMPIPT